MALSAGDTPSLDRTLAIDPTLRSIVERAMAYEPSDRFATAEEMRLALEGYLDAQPEGGHVQARDIGEMLSEVCVERHAATKREIAEVVRHIERGRSQAPTPLVPKARETVSVVMPSAARIPIGLDEQYRAGESAALARPQTSGTGTGRRARELEEDQQDFPKSGRRGAWLYGLAALFLIVALIILIWKPDDKAAQDNITPDKAIVGAPQITPSEAPVQDITAIEDIGAEKPSSAPAAENEAPSAATKPAAAKPSATTKSPRQPRPTAPKTPPAPQAAETAPAAPSAPTKASAPAKPSKNCNPPYYFSEGIKTYKPECL